MKYNTKFELALCYLHCYNVYCTYIDSHAMFKDMQCNPICHKWLTILKKQYGTKTASAILKLAIKLNKEKDRQCA